MVAPELLHHYPFFSTLTIPQLKAVAEISKEDYFERGTILFQENDRAHWLYLLLKGSVDLFFAVDRGIFPVEHKEMHFDTVRPGEIFGISALIEPFIYTSSARAANPGEAVKIDALKLLNIFREDELLAFQVMEQVAKATIERLNAARLQMAAVWMEAHEARER
jgi:CRP/FNR family transcriptional activator FtrB